MQYRNRLIIICIFLFASFQLSAQKNKLEEKDITGLWKGFMYNDTTQKNYRYEIAISESKGKLYGYSHTYFILDDREYHGVKKLKIKRNGTEVITEDVELIANNYPIKPPKGVHVLNILRFQIKDTVMILSGMFSTNRTREFAPATGYIHVERKKDYSQSALVPHLEELGLAKNLSFLKEGAEEITTTLKPLISEEAEKLIVIAAKRQQPDYTVKASTMPAVKESVVVMEVPKPAEQVIIKPVTPKQEPSIITKIPEPVIVKTTPPKPVEAVAIKPTAPKIKPEPVITSKPVTPKPTDPIIAKVPPTKTTEPVEVKPAPVKKTDPLIISAATDIDKRKVETIKAVYFKTDSLVLTLYDNGEVDGDTVSVVMNGNIIMPKVGLSTNAVKKTIDTKAAGDSIQLIMYAESLGSLPPNTGLLIVYDGADRYEIRFSGDMQKSSAIIFRRKKN